MTQTEIPVPAPCASALDALTQCPKPLPAGVLDDAIASVQQKTQHFAYEADLRSPSDCYHPEAYLIGSLVKLYGWRVLEPGLLARTTKPAPCAPVPAPRREGETCARSGALVRVASAAPSDLEVA